MAVGIATGIREDESSIIHSFCRCVLLLLPVAFDANGNRHSPGGGRLSISGHAQIH